MRFEDGSGHYADIHIEGYQYAMAESVWDLNWLVVAGSVQDLSGRREFRDPCLLRWELDALAAWFESLATGQPTDGDPEFLEPDLRFRLVRQDDDAVALDVVVGLGAGAIRVNLGSPDLAALAAELRVAGDRFPERHAAAP